MKFEDKLKVQGEAHLRKIRMWLNHHLQGEVNIELAINKLRQFDKMFNEKVAGLRNVVDNTEEPVVDSE
jgi:uncharacterized protein YwgA